MEFVPIIIAAIVGLGAGAGVVFAYDKKNENGGKNKADDLIRKAKNEASDIVLRPEKRRLILLRNQKMKRIAGAKIGNKLKNVSVSVKSLLIINLIKLKNVLSVFLAKKRKLRNSKMRFIPSVTDSKKSLRKLPLSLKMRPKKN